MTTGCDGDADDRLTVGAHHGAAQSAGFEFGQGNRLKCCHLVLNHRGVDEGGPIPSGPERHPVGSRSQSLDSEGARIRGEDAGGGAVPRVVVTPAGARRDLDLGCAGVGERNAAGDSGRGGEGDIEAAGGVPFTDHDDRCRSLIIRGAGRAVIGRGQSVQGR